MTAPALTPEQQAVVDLPPTPCLVVAPPGCGKTEVLVRRVESLLASSSRRRRRVLVLTFTRVAADNVVARVRARLPDQVERVEAQRFHKFCHELLRTQAPERLRTVYDRRVDRVDALRLALEGAGLTPPDSLENLLDEIERAKKTLVFERPEEFQERSDEFRLAFELYARQLQTMRACDFDDLILDVVDLLRSSEWPLSLLQRLYSSVLVDEAQDLNAAQYALLKVLCGTSVRDIMLFADERQSIFAFNGADRRILDQFSQDFGATRRNLTLSFRCGSRIVAAANAIAAPLLRKVEPLRAPGHRAPGDIRLEGTPTEQDEAALVTDAISTLLADGLPVEACHPGESTAVALEEIAVLGRSRYALASVEAAIRAKFGQVLTSYGHDEAVSSAPGQAVLWLLRSLAHPADVVVRHRLAEATGLEDATLLRTTVPDALLTILMASAGTAAGRLAATARQALTSGDVVGALLEELAQEALLIGDDSTAAEVHADADWLQRIRRNLRRDLGREPLPAEFTQAFTMDSTRPVEGPGVRVLTVHAAKGQEYRAVFMVGMFDGGFPSYRAKTTEQRDEERRLCYVAVTRASRLLVCSWPRTRRWQSGQTAFTVESIFESDIRRSQLSPEPA